MSVEAAKLNQHTWLAIDVTVLAAKLNQHTWMLAGGGTTRRRQIVNG